MRPEVEAKTYVPERWEINDLRTPLFDPLPRNAHKLLLISSCRSTDENYLQPIIAFRNCGEMRRTEFQRMSFEPLRQLAL